MTEATDEEILALLAQGVSQRTIAKRLHVGRGRINRLVARQQGLPDRHRPEVHRGITEILPCEQMAPTKGVPADMVFDIMEMVEWWRQRKKIAQEYEGTPRQTQRMTYHVEPRFIELIKQFAKAEGVSVTDVVNRAFRQFFEGR